MRGIREHFTELPSGRVVRDEATPLVRALRDALCEELPRGYDEFEEWLNSPASREFVERVARRIRDVKE